jgi:hypothetical protein
LVGGGGLSRGRSRPLAPACEADAEKTKTTTPDPISTSSRNKTKTTPEPPPPNSIIPGPPEYQALVERAAAIWTSTTAPFPRELREAWGRNGALAAWWEEIPDRRHWRTALDELATDEKGPPTLRRFLRFVQNVSRRPPPAANGRPHGDPPKPRREKRTPEEIKAFLAEVAAFQFGPRERRT